MARLLVGLPALQGTAETYASRFDLVELRPLIDALPKPATLRRWRRSVPPSFVFSVVMPPVVGELAPGPALDAALASSLEIAAILESRCVVVQTPPEVRPTSTNKKRLGTLFDRIPREGTVRCWEPSGLWERDEILATARAIGVLPVFDVARDAPAPGPTVYTRLRALGKSTNLGAATMMQVAERVKKRREVFVVVEGSRDAVRVKRALELELERSPMRSSSVTVVRPNSSTLVAEDEEQ